MTRPFRLTAPEPLELDIHQTCARLLNQLLLPPAVWFSAAIGAVKLTPQQAARYSSIGVKAGLPDIFIIYQGLWGVELKRSGGQLSRTRIVHNRRGSPRIVPGQTDTFPQLIAAGMRRIAVAHSPEEMLAALQRWEIPMRRYQ